MIKILLLLFALLAVAAVWKNLRTPPHLGVVNQKLVDCPNSPNCVSSFAKDREHAIDPIKFAAGDPLPRLKQLLVDHYEVIIEKESEDYLHVVFISNLMRFRDDVEFLVDRKNRVIHVRSASRVGYGDLGVNRKRVEEIRELYLQKVKSD